MTPLGICKAMPDGLRCWPATAGRPAAAGKQKGPWVGGYVSVAMIGLVGARFWKCGNGWG